jgi:hypothetical protein
VVQVSDLAGFYLGLGFLLGMIALSRGISDLAGVLRNNTIDLLKKAYPPAVSPPPTGGAINLRMDNGVLKIGDC